MTTRMNTSRKTLLALGLVLGLSLAGWRVGASEYGQRLSERLHQPATAQQVERLKVSARRSLALSSASASTVTPPSALLFTADYTITTTATNIIVTDVSGAADTLTVSQPSAGNIKFAAAGRNFSVDGGADILGDSGTLTRSGITSITVNASADTINLGGFTGTLPSLSATGTNFNAGAIPLNTNSALTVNVTGTTSAITGIISGTGGSLTKGGTGRLTLSSPANTDYINGVPGSNTYTGTTTVNAGTLVLKSGFVTAYNGGAIAINGASTFRVEGNRYDFTNKSFTFDATGGGTLDFSALGFGGSVFFGPTNVATNGGATNNIIGVNTGINTHLSATFNFNVAAGSGPTDLAVSALLWNGGSIVKDGPGILTLSYANTYAGTTTVNAGKLLVTGSLSAGGGGVSVNNTGTLGGTGTVNRVVTVNAGGFVAPGLSVGILNTSNVNFTSGSNFAVEIAGNGGAGDANGYDQLNVTGSATINNAALSLNFAGLTAGELSLGQTFVILNNDSTDAVIGAFAGLAEGATVATNLAGSGKDLKISYAGGTGNDAVLTVALSPCTPPVINTQPSGATVCAGSPASFSVGATGTSLSYQWRKGGMAIGGATGATLSIAAAVAGDAGSYDVIVTSTCGTLTSTAATLTVNATTAISTQPAGATKMVGQSMTFSVAATGTGLSYQWRKGSVAIGGATASSFSISFVTLGDAGSYDVVVSGACGSVSSDAATLTINRPPVAVCQNITVTSDATCSASADINNGSSDPDGDSLTITQTPAGPYALGTQTVTLMVDDGRGGTNTCSATVTVNAPKPVPTITGPTASGLIYQANTPIPFTGTFTDPLGTTHTASWKFERATPPAITTAADTVVEPSGLDPGTVSKTQSFTTPGVYLVTLTVTNNCGGSEQATTIGTDQFSALVVIYDPGAGFVTGGGWINSPAGAYVADMMLTGKANFGFVSKYQNGANVPTGNTEFQFKAGNLNFKSTVYEWLVIAGARAQYKGSGKINGAGDYRFMLTAIDGQVNGGGGADKFRIRIWNDAGGGLVYDNQMNADDNDNPTTALGGGSIVIHK